MKCTYRAAKLLQENQELKVHSVYRHTVNIVVNERILAFHCDMIPSTPLSLSLPFSEEEFDWFEREAQRTGLVSIHISCEDKQLFLVTETQQNETVNSHETEELSAKSLDRYCWISTGDFKQNAGKIILWEDKLDKQDKLKKLNLNQQDKNIAENILSVLLPILTRNYQLGGFSDCAVTTQKRKDDSFITQILREKTATILSKDKNTSENQKTNFEKQICSLIGLGPGLTPSGDDFLTGMLLAFSLQKNIGACIKIGIEIDIRNNIGTENDKEIVTITKELDEKQKQICKVVSKNLERTNDISKEYLLCATENRFGEVYHELQEQLCCGNVQQDIFCRIIHTGHSSGLDTLNGLAVGLKMIRTMGQK